MGSWTKHLGRRRKVAARRHRCCAPRSALHGPTALLSLQKQCAPPPPLVNGPQGTTTPRPTTCWRCEPSTLASPKWRAVRCSLRGRATQVGKGHRGPACGGLPAANKDRPCWQPACTLLTGSHCGGPSAFCFYYRPSRLSSLVKACSRTLPAPWARQSWPPPPTYHPTHPSI